MDETKKEELLEKMEELLLKGARGPLKVIPLWVEATAFGAFIKLVVDANPDLKERLPELDGKVMLFEATDLGKSFYLLIEGEGIRVRPHYRGEPDAVMRGALKVLVRVMLGKEDPDTVFFSRELEINGDTAVALHFKNILCSI